MSEFQSRLLSNLWRSRRRAMTLVEVLAATVLASLLMVAVLGVLTSVTRGQKALLNSDVPDAWQRRLTAQLEWDLENSRSMRNIPGGILLDGFAARDPRTGTPIHCLSAVAYLIRGDGKATHLIRQETHPESLSLHNSRTELVCADVERIEFGRAAATQHRKSNQPSVPASKGLSDGPIPHQLNVELYRKGSVTPVYVHGFALR